MVRSNMQPNLPTDMQHVTKQSQYLRQEADRVGDLGAYSESQAQDILPKTQEKNQSQLQKEYNNRIESSTKARDMKDSIQNNILQNKQQIASNLQTDEPKISAKVATSKQTAAQQFNSQQRKFKDKSDLTTYRVLSQANRDRKNIQHALDENIVKPAVKILSQNPITDSDTDQYEPMNPNPNDKKGR